MDLRVLEVQVWLGNTFPNYFYYDENGTGSGSFPVKPDGMTGNTTVKALIMALQIHLGLTPVDGIWGNGTSSACPTISQSTQNTTLIKIMQGGFICKGYNPGPLDGVFGNSSKNAIINFKADLGFPNASDTLPAAYFKSLLTTDPTLVTNSTNGPIRLVQQYLNANYSSLYLSALGFIPTSGHFERKTSRALIFAFQSVIGTTADGALGPNTFSRMPNLSINSNAVAQVKILQCALICNKFYADSIDGTFDQDLADRVTNFQEFMCLNLDPAVVLGSVNRRTWGALLWSKGDTDRIPNAADTRFQLTAVQAQSLYNDGIRYIGRYLTKVPNGYDKHMTEAEISNIHNAGLKIFPLFQENNASASDFDYDTGYDSWVKAVEAATRLRIPSCVIYFCVDFDATEAQARGIVTEYFQGINDARIVNEAMYQVGIYSARNTCSVICSAGLAVRSFVSNMSTGYSGNLGFLMPDNWSFDQYATGPYTASDGSRIDLDKVIASGKDMGVDAIDGIGDTNWYPGRLQVADIATAVDNAVLVNSVIPLIIQLENVYWQYKPTGSPNSCIKAVLFYLWHKKYTHWHFTQTLPTDSDFSDYVLVNYPLLYAALDLYIRENGYLILKDTSNRLFELHHLAAVILAYIQSVFPAEWYGWAGDMASAFHEINTLQRALGIHYVGDLEHARDRIGEMEVPPDDVQMNYCDIFGDADGFGIYTIIMAGLNKNIEKEHILSGAFQQYYDTHYTSNSIMHYTKRMLYLLNNLPIEKYSIEEISSKLYSYFLERRQQILIISKANMGSLDAREEAIIAACCRAFAEVVMHEFNLH